MNKEDLLTYKRKLMSLSEEEIKLRNIYLRKLSLGEIHGPNCNYPSIDKTWLKYYKEYYIMSKLPNMTCYEFLKKCNEDNLDSIAIESYEGTYTYNELFEIIDKTAVSLYEMGIKKGHNVMMFFGASFYEPVLLYSIDAVGAALSEVPIQLTLSEIIEKINNLDIDMFFVDGSLLNHEMEKEIYNKTKVKNIIYTGKYMNSTNVNTISWNCFLEKGKGKILPKIEKNPNDLLFIASTGGSTGKPKSVMLSDNCFNFAAHQYINSDLNYNKGDRWLRLWALFSASACISNNHLPLCAGMHNIIRSFPMNINEFDQMVQLEKPNHLVLIPQLMDVLDKSEILDKDLNYIKTIGCGGLAITNQFENRIQEFLYKHNIKTYIGYGWGCTESFTIGSIRSNYDTSLIGGVGAPLVDTIVSTFDPDTLEEKEFGEEGELCIKTPVTMLGYYKDKQNTSNVLKMHSDGSIWLHTGDLGVINEDGIVTVIGRMTRTIFVFPVAKLYPTELENLISKIPGVLDVVVCEIPDLEHEGFSLPVCYVIPQEDQDIHTLENDIRDVCNISLPEYARPCKYIFVNEFPLTKVGKKDVKTLENKLR